LFPATLYVTTPLPVPLAPLVIVIHASLLVAVHAQVLAVVTVTAWPPPPPHGMPLDAGEIVYQHAAGGGGGGGGGAPAAA
jgi:hypothetical protein